MLSNPFVEAAAFFFLLFFLVPHPNSILCHHRYWLPTLTHTAQPISRRMEIFWISNSITPSLSFSSTLPRVELVSGAFVENICNRIIWCQYLKFEMSIKPVSQFLWILSHLLRRWKISFAIADFLSENHLKFLRSPSSHYCEICVLTNRFKY